MKLNTDEGEMHVSTPRVKPQKQFVQFVTAIGKGCCVPIIQIRESTGTVQPVLDIYEAGRDKKE